MKEIISSFFHKLGDRFCNNLSEKIMGLMKAGTANTADVARSLSVINNKNFKTNDMSIYRFLQNDKFQIDDRFWRCHIKLIFSLLKERKIIKKGDKIQINIDFTSSENYFLILSASILVNEKAITIYFSMRNYPNKKDQMSQIKMDTAFIKALRHLLPKKYSYIVVADRGFGNDRFASLCANNGFDFVLRLNSNLNIKIGEKALNLKEFDGNNEKFEAYVVAWKKAYQFQITTENGSSWFLMSKLQGFDLKSIYEKRFKIEHCFKDYKSAGFDIEKIKIRKYDRFKRWLYCVMLAHVLVTILGDFIDKECCDFKKKFAAHSSLALAYSSLDMRPLRDILENPPTYLKRFFHLELGGEVV